MRCCAASERPPPDRTRRRALAMLQSMIDFKATTRAQRRPLPTLHGPRCCLASSRRSGAHCQRAERYVMLVAGSETRGRRRRAGSRCRCRAPAPVDAAAASPHHAAGPSAQMETNPYCIQVSAHEPYAAARPSSPCSRTHMQPAALPTQHTAALAPLCRAVRRERVGHLHRLQSASLISLTHPAVLRSTPRAGGPSAPPVRTPSAKGSCAWAPRWCSTTR